MTMFDMDIVCKDTLDALKKLGAMDERSAKPLDDVFRASRLPWGHLNQGLLTLRRQGKVGRVEVNGAGMYFCLPAGGPPSP